MAGFGSSWVKAAGGIRAALLAQEEERRQKETERIRAEHLVLAQQEEAREAAAQAASLAAQKLAQEQAERTLAEEAVARAGVGGNIAGPDAARARRLTPDMVDVTGGETTLPASTLPVTAAPLGGAPPVSVGGMDLPIVETVAPIVTSRGTNRQRAMKKIADTPNMSDRDIAISLIDASGDDNIPASMAALLSNEDRSIPLFRRENDGSLMKQDDKGNFTVPHIGNLPERHKIINEPSESSMNPSAGGGSPYFIPVQTAGGIIPFNSRTGQFNDEDRRDLKLGETAAAQISNAEVIGKNMDLIARDFTPEKVGALQGRLSNLDQKFWGSDPEYAELIGSVRTLQNTVIQLRTGAQMSVQEAKRIMDELPDEKTPAPTFVAKLNRARDYYNEWLKTRARVGYGRTTEAERDRVTTEGFGPGTPLPTDTAGAGAAKPPTPRKNINPFRK